MVVPNVAGSMMRELGIDIRLLDREALQAQEPTLKPIFNSGYHLRAGGRVNNPGLLMREHAERFVADGGELLEGDVSDINESQDSVSWTLENDIRSSDRLTSWAR